MTALQQRQLQPKVVAAAVSCQLFFYMYFIECLPLNALGMRYESILKDAEKMGLDDIAEVAKQRLYQIADEMEKAREQWNLHA